MNRCPNTDCEYHGKDGCYKDITLVECEHCGGLRCLQYTPRITCKDLEAPFNANCHKGKGGKWVDNTPIKVFK